MNLPDKRIDLPAANRLNASEHLFAMIDDNEKVRQLPIVTVAQLGYAAELLNSYRFVAGRLLRDNPELVERLRTFAPEHLAAVQGDL
jgi:hypothetical protein